MSTGGRRWRCGARVISRSFPLPFPCPFLPDCVGTAGTVFSAMVLILLAGSTLNCELLRHLDVDLFRLGLFSLRHGYQQQPVAILRVDFSVVDFDRQSDGAHEFAGGALLTMDCLRLDVRGSSLLLARDRQRVVDHGEVE